MTVESRLCFLRVKPKHASGAGRAAAVGRTPQNLQRPPEERIDGLGSPARIAGHRAVVNRNHEPAPAADRSDGMREKELVLTDAVILCYGAPQRDADADSCAFPAPTCRFLPIGIVRAHEEAGRDFQRNLQAVGLPFARKRHAVPEQIPFVGAHAEAEVAHALGRRKGGRIVAAPVFILFRVFRHELREAAGETDGKAHVLGAPGHSRPCAVVD